MYGSSFIDWSGALREHAQSVAQDVVYLVFGRNNGFSVFPTVQHYLALSLRYDFCVYGYRLLLRSNTWLRYFVWCDECKYHEHKVVFYLHRSSSWASSYSTKPLFLIDLLCDNVPNWLINSIMVWKPDFIFNRISHILYNARQPSKATE